MQDSGFLGEEAERELRSGLHHRRETALAFGNSQSSMVQRSLRVLRRSDPDSVAMRMYEQEAMNTDAGYQWCEELRVARVPLMDVITGGRSRSLQSRLSIGEGTLLLWLQCQTICALAPMYSA